MEVRGGGLGGEEEGIPIRWGEAVDTWGGCPNMFIGLAIATIPAVGMPTEGPITGCIGIAIEFSVAVGMATTPG